MIFFQAKVVSNDLIVVQEIDTFFGKCFMIDLKRKIKISTEALLIRINDLSDYAPGQPMVSFAK